MIIEHCGNEYDVTPVATRYMNDNLAVLLFEPDREEFGALTVNLGDDLPPDTGYLDTNNLPDAEGFVLRHGIATYTGEFRGSGFCTYPLYRFDMGRLVAIEEMWA